MLRPQYAFTPSNLSYSDWSSKYPTYVSVTTYSSQLSMQCSLSKHVSGNHPNSQVPSPKGIDLCQVNSCCLKERPTSYHELPHKLCMPLVESQLPFAQFMTTVALTQTVLSLPGLFEGMVGGYMSFWP